MAWWLALYLILYGSLWIVALYDDYQERRSIFTTWMDYLSGVIIILFIFAYAYPGIDQTIRPFIPLMLIAGGMWEIYDVYNECTAILREHDTDPEMAQEEVHRLIRWAVLMAVLLTVPGYALGLLLLL